MYEHEAHRGSTHPAQDQQGIMCTNNVRRKREQEVFVPSRRLSDAQSPRAPRAIARTPTRRGSDAWRERSSISRNTAKGVGEVRAGAVEQGQAVMRKGRDG